MRAADSRCAAAWVARGRRSVSRSRACWNATSGALPGPGCPRPGQTPPTAVAGVMHEGRTGHQPDGQGEPPPNSEAWPASPLPATTALPGPGRERCHSAACLTALQPPSLLGTAAALRHWTDSTGPDYYGGSAPSGRSAVSAPIPKIPGRMPAPGELVPDGSRVHCDPLGGLGARLCPSGLAMGTPQAFPMASRGRSSTSPRKFPPLRYTAGRTAPGPYPPDLSRCRN